ncbi:MAG: hypothetical protein ACPGQQ_02695 [Candidatus Puniceispirillaceae bacterium]
MKQEINHTPAPWFVHTLGQHYNNPNLIDIAVCFGDYEHICDTVYRPEDAKLIAAAPEMLEALKQISECIDMQTAYEIADKILEKMRGAP